MKHALKVSYTKEPVNDGIVACRKVTVRERLLRFLLGDKIRLTVIVPGDSVQELDIREIPKKAPNVPTKTPHTKRTNASIIFGNMIREARAGLGLSHKDLANEFNISEKAVGQWERGITFPVLSRAFQISAKLGLNIETVKKLYIQHKKEPRA